MSYDVERNIDAIEVEVFSNRILAIIEEMGAKLVRSSFSPNINFLFPLTCVKPVKK